MRLVFSPIIGRSEEKTEIMDSKNRQHITNHERPRTPKPANRFSLISSNPFSRICSSLFKEGPEYGRLERKLGKSIWTIVLGGVVVSIFITVVIIVLIWYCKDREKQSLKRQRDVSSKDTDIFCLCGQTFILNGDYF